MSSPVVQILLSTYNGSKYLSAQLDSILEQTEKDWQLLIRDDGSTDNTVQIVQDYNSRFPNRIKLVAGGEGGNSSSSFIAMLNHVTAPYIMFCDQDDVWKPNKVQSSLLAIRSLEQKNPVALHFTDMQVVNADLEPIHPSFFEHQKLLPQWSQDPYEAFVQSCAAGCTMIFTQVLVKKLHPIIAPLFQHDHWLLMHASYYGVVDFATEPTVLYRQHGDNVLGAHAVDSRYFISKVRSSKDLFRRWRYIQQQFGAEISFWKLIFAKWRVNRQRLS